MNVITSKEKDIYNKFLAISRSSVNKPFKLRKNFDNFEENENYLYIKKLNLFFNKFSHIEIDEFFKAPYVVYENITDSLDLKFYTSRKALKLYTMYQTKKLNEPPDSLNQLFFIKKSLSFILNFCTLNNIPVDEYTSHTTNSVYTFILHLKEHRISIYTLFGFPDAEKKLKGIGDDLVEFIFGDLKNKLDIFRTRYYTSNKAKVLVNEGLKKLKQKT